MKNSNQNSFFTTTQKNLLAISLFFLFNSAMGNTNASICLKREIAKIDNVTEHGQDVIFPKEDHPGSQDQPYYEIPFIFRMKMMLIETTIKGESGYLILDTGMEKAIFNKKYFNWYTSTQKITGVNASVQNLPSTIVKLQLGNLPTHRMGGGVLDLHLLEQYLQTKVLGICGIAFLKKFQWVIDYKNQLIFLYPIDKNGELLETTLLPPTETVDLGTIRHLLYVEARVGSNMVKLGLDTGASSTMLTHKYIKTLANYLTLTNTNKTTTIIGVCGSKKISDQYILSQLMIGEKMILSTKVITGSLNRINQWSKIKLAGVFNPMTLRQYVIGLNWEKKQLYVWSKWDWPGTESLVDLN